MEMRRSDPGVNMTITEWVALPSDSKLGVFEEEAGRWFGISS